MGSGSCKLYPSLVVSSESYNLQFEPKFGRKLKKPIFSATGHVTVESICERAEFFWENLLHVWNMSSTSMGMKLEEGHQRTQALEQKLL